MTDLLDDSRNRPVVFETHAEPAPRRLPNSRRVLVGATVVVGVLAGSAGLAFGGSAVWSVVGPKASNNTPAPLWIAPPPRVSAPEQHDASAVDPDHKTLTNDAATTTKAPTHETESHKGSGSSGPGSGSSSGSGSSGSGATGSHDTHETAATQAPTAASSPTTNGEPEPGDDGHRKGASGGGPHGGDGSGRG